MAKTHLSGNAALGGATPAETLASVRRKYGTFFENKMFAFFITRPDGFIMEANEAACKMFGYTKEEFRKLGRQHVIDPETPGLDEKLNERLKNGKADGELLGVRKNGERFWCEFSSSLFDLENGDVCATVLLIDISDRKFAQNQLKNVADNIPGVLFRYVLFPDETDGFLFVNQGSQLIWGIEPNEAMKNNEVVFKRFNPDDLSNFRNTIKNAAESGSSWNCEWRYHHPDGTIRWHRGSGNRVEGGQNFTGWDALVLDITAEKSSKHNLEKIYETISDALFTLEADRKGDFRFSSVNRQFLDNMGLQHNEVVGQKYSDVIPKKSVPFVTEKYRQAIENHETVTWEETVHLKTGTKTGIVTVTPVFDDKGRFYQLIGSINDITKRKRAEEMLKKTADEMQLLMNNTKESFVLLDKNLTVISFNRQFDQLSREFWGQTIKHGYYILDYVSKEKLNEVSASYKRVLQGKEEESLIEIPRPDEKTLIYSIHRRPAYDKNGTIIGAFVTSVDVTEKKSHYERLKESEKNYRTLFNLSPVPKIIFDPETLEILDVNQNAREAYGYSPGEFKTMKLSDLQAGMNEDELRKLFKRSGHQSILLGSGTFKHRKKDGTLLDIDVTGHEIVLNNRKCISIVCNDVTEMKRRELKQTFLSSISNAFSSNEGMRDAVKGALNHLKTLAGFEMNELWLVSQNKKTIDLAGFLCEGLNEFYPSETSNLSFKKGEGLPGVCWADKAFTYWTDLGNHPKFVRCDQAKKAGLTFALGVPLIFNNKVVGSLLLGSKKSRVLSPEIKSLLIDAATQLAEEVHRKSLEEELNRIFSFAPDIICVAGFDGYFRKVNPAMSEMLGYTEEELLTRHITEFTHPDDREKTREEIEAINTGTGKASFENRYITKSGKTIWLSWTTRNFTTENITFAIGRDVTIEKELRTLLDQTTKLARIGSWEFDPREKNPIAYWSDMTREILEVDSGFEPRLDDGLRFYSKESRPAITKAVEEAISKGKPFDLELEVVTAKGRKKWVRAIGQADFRGGECERVWGSYQDIDELKKAEFAYKKTMKERDKILQSISDAFFALDSDWNFTYFNYEAENLLERKAEDVIGKNVWEEFAPAVGTNVYNVYNRVMKTGTAESLEYFYPPLNRWFDITAYPWENGISVYFKNINERKRVEEQIRRKTTQLDAIASFNGLLIKDVKWTQALNESLPVFGDVAKADRVYFFENSRSPGSEEPVTSIKLEWVREVTEPMLEHPDHHNLPFSEIWYFMKELTANKPFNTRVADIEDAQFREFLQSQDIKSVLALPVNVGDEFYGFVGFDDCTKERIWEDDEITFLKTICINLASAIEGDQAEIALQNSYNEKNEILESIGDGFFRLDKNSVVTYWNYQAEKLLKASRKEMIGQYLWSVFDNTMAMKSFNNYTTCINEQKAATFEDYYEPIKKWFDVNVYPSGGGISVFFKDITDRKKSEEQLRKLNTELKDQTRKLAISNAELEQFAFVASHDLQEPLRMITSFLAQIEKKYSEKLDEKGKKYIYFATDGAKRMRQIILDLLEFSRVGREDFERETINLNILMDEVIALNKKLAQESNTRFEYDNLPKIVAARSSMYQLFQNLIHNAIKYKKTDEHPVIKISGDEDKNYWYVRVEDNGIGISEEYYDKIFNIFQRLHNKDEFSGTGMGLAICKKIVEEHGGTISVESEPDKGSTFTFSIAKA